MKAINENIMQHEPLNVFASIGDALHDILGNIYAVLVGVIMAALGYFIPIKDIVNLLVVFFMLDVCIGYWAAKKLRKEKFSVKIIWGHTMPRMLLSIVLIIGAFLWDKTYSQDFVSTYKVIGWFISGVLLYSIAENAYQITKWKVFPRLAELFNSKTKEKTGMEINEEPKPQENESK